jgi:hypothetical protein
VAVKDGRKEKSFWLFRGSKQFWQMVSSTVERKKNTLGNLISILKTGIDAGQTIITKIHGEIRTKRGGRRPK